MSVRQKFMAAVKTVLAVILAVVILDAFCAWYYNPAEYVWDEYRSTDRIRMPGAATSRAKEGFSSCTVDANGYNNPSVPGDDGVYVLMMGTSHTEGFNVKQDETTTVQLQRRMSDAGMEGRVYNIGMSSHSLMLNLSNLDRAIERFQPQGYVIIETERIDFSADRIENAINDGFERMAQTDYPIPKWITDRPIVRAVVKQIENMIAQSDADSEEATEAGQEFSDESLQEYRMLLGKLFAQVRGKTDAQELKLIIYYHPMLKIQQDGHAIQSVDQRMLAAFAGACDDAGICFINMGDKFVETYEQEHVLPHGFANTAPEYGHMNRNGTAQAADVLLQKMIEMEDVQ